MDSHGRQKHFPCGIVEGFYGRGWSKTSRCRLIEFLQHVGLNTYLYCPKADASLRKQWARPFTEAEQADLQALSAYAKARNVVFGMGLSPVELYRDYNENSKKILFNKIKEINSLDVKLLAILFDDMPGDLGELASLQGDIVRDIASWSRADSIVMCPTYYSFDSVLERHFGTMPDDYWETLGRCLPESVNVFWTGNEVCSVAIGVDDIQRINQRLGRKVMLWDNYPVNDGATRSNHLYLTPLPCREPHLDSVITGHLCNPMNQALLSMLPLTGLGAMYSRAASTDQQANAQDLYGDDVANRLLVDIELFEHVGLNGLSVQQRERLAVEYSALNHPAAEEVADWLRGEYCFDPACLTD